MHADIVRCHATTRKNGAGWESKHKPVGNVALVAVDLVAALLSARA